jgi:hypothetical protein
MTIFDGTAKAVRLQRPHAAALQKGAAQRAYRISDHEKR